MIYIGTNIIVSYMDEADANHSKAAKLIQSLRGEKLVTSRLALVKLASVYSRAGLEDPLALALYSIKETVGRTSRDRLQRCIITGFPALS